MYTWGDRRSIDRRDDRSDSRGDDRPVYTAYNCARERQKYRPEKNEPSNAEFYIASTQSAYYTLWFKNSVMFSNNSNKSDKFIYCFCVCAESPFNLSHIGTCYFTFAALKQTRKLSYRKDDRAMRPMSALQMSGVPDYAHGYFSRTFNGLFFRLI